MAPIETQAPEQHPHEHTLSAISNDIVRLYKEYFGRGPTKARTHWCGEDLLVVVLEDTLAPGERNLVRMNEHQRLRDTRMFFQYATLAEFCEPVERHTGRTVRSFVSGVDTKVDGLSVETYVLWPRGEDGASRASLDALARPVA